MASQYPMTQPDEPSTSEQESPIMDDPDDPHPNPLTRSIAGKSLYELNHYPEGSYSHFEERSDDLVHTNYPDLYEYFSDYDMSHEDQIAYCRRYASSLAAANPKKKRKVSEKSK